MAEKYAPLCSSSTETMILDLPTEVLSKIILFLTPRERIPLGYSCQRLKTFVFGDPELLRYLDFSKKGYLTTMTDIQAYFSNDETCRHVRRVNARYVECMKPGELLSNSIGRATNLVEVNIHGTQFEDILQLDSFLNSLLHVEKLSIDWPKTLRDDIGLCRQILQRPFSKLTYLSVALGKSALARFTDCLSLCQQLQKLVMVTDPHPKTGVRRNLWTSEIKALTNLKIIQYHGGKDFTIKQELAALLPDPKRWTDFQLCGPEYPQGFYIEKDVKVCEELLRSERLQDFLYPDPSEKSNLGWSLDPERLLKAVLRITHQDLPDNFCCLSESARERGGGLYLLKIEDAKMLLKNPRWQITYLQLNHEVEADCDAHLLASALPSVSELVLSAVTRGSETSPERSRCSPVPEGQDDSVNLDSSFKLLVKNTPKLRHLLLNPTLLLTADWDLDALYEISAWKSLETLEIHGVYIGDGEFLIDIGKQCKDLQKLSLCNLPPWGRICYYQDALFEMLEHCRKLRDITIVQNYVDHVEMFELLARNVDLGRVCACNTLEGNSISDWIQSLEKLIRRCEKLTTISCTIGVKSEDDYNEVESAVKRFKREFRRPDFQIKVSCSIAAGKRSYHRTKQIGQVYSDTPEPQLFYTR